MNLDRNLVLQLNQFANNSTLMRAVAVFIGEYSQYLLCLFLAALIFFPKKNRLKNQIMVFVSLVAAVIARWVVKTGILLVYNRPRPFIVVSGIHKLIATYTYENYQSFPSGHAIFFFALATALFMFNKKLGLWYFLAAIAMSLARVMAGVHWPTDILGGAVLGMLVGWVTYRFYFINQLTTEKVVSKIFTTFKL